MDRQCYTMIEIKDFSNYRSRDTRLMMQLPEADICGPNQRFGAHVYNQHDGR